MPSSASPCLNALVQQVDPEGKSFEMSVLLGSYHHEFLAGNKWKCNILIWNQLFLKEEGLYYTFPSKSHFWLFFLFWSISPFLWSTTWYLYRNLSIAFQSDLNPCFLFLAELWAFEVVLLKKLILRKIHLMFWNVHSLKQLPSWIFSW